MLSVEDKVLYWQKCDIIRDHFDDNVFEFLRYDCDIELDDRRYNKFGILVVYNKPMGVLKTSINLSHYS